MKTEWVELELGKHSGLVGIILQGPGKTHLESLKMRTALYRVDIVDVRINLLGVARIVLESDLDWDYLVCLKTRRRFL